MSVVLLCAVRGCGRPLSCAGPACVCPLGHSFDRARSGYLNLLQPQDRRSARPGDSAATARARRRFLEAGHANELLDLLRQFLADRDLPNRPTVLDVGCGEGFFLRRLATHARLEAHGLDISVPAVDMAARALPTADWAVANADRFLPYADASFDLLLSINARRNPAEYRRILKPDGLFVLVLPAPDDLRELRAGILGAGPPQERMGKAIDEFSSSFRTRSRHRVERRAILSREEIADLLAATYRGGRHSREERLAQWPGGEITLSQDVAVLTPLCYDAHQTPSCGAEQRTTNQQRRKEVMAKDKNIKKEAKKAPSKSIKEKRKAKEEKKAAKAK